MPAKGGKATVYSQEDFSVIAVFPNSRSVLSYASEPGFSKKFIRVYPDSTFFELTKWGGFYSDISPDGNLIVFTHKGYPYREKYKGSANGDLWLYNIKTDSYKRLTRTLYTERYPVFSKNKKNIIYFAASDGKVFQLYQADINDLAHKKQLTHFKKWSVRDISIAYKNDRMVFEFFDKIYKYDPATQKASEIKITINQDFINDYIDLEYVRNKFDNFAISPNGKLIVFSYKYDLFAIPEKGGKVLQLTHSQSGINDIVIMNDNKTIFFTSMPTGKPQLFKVNINNPTKIEEVVWTKGKYIEQVYKQRNYLIVHYSTKDKNYNLAFADSIGRHFRIIEDKKNVNSAISFSPDEKYAIYWTIDPTYWTREIYIYNLKTKEKMPIKSSYKWLSTSAWGQDGKTAFISISGDIYRIDLLPKDYFYLKKDYWKEILNPSEKTKKQKKKINVQIDFKNLENRFTKIVGLKGSNLIVYIPNDSMFYYINNYNGKGTLRKTDYLGENDKKVFSFNSEVWNIQYNKKNKKFYYIEDDKLKSLNPNSKDNDMLTNKFKYSYDKIKLNQNIFKQVWERFGKGYYDKNMHNVNWKKMYNLFSKYLPYVYRTKILDNIISEMIGEVNSSHTGFYPRSESEVIHFSKAYLGCTFDYKWFPEEGIKIDKIYATSKLKETYNIKEGDILLSVDNHKIMKGRPFNKYFYDKVNKKIVLKIKSQDTIRTISVKGLSYSQNSNLYYDDWVEQNRKLVSQLSNDRFAYLHIKAMDYSSYNKFIDELYSKYLDKDALILDLRNNGGGNTHEKVLEVFTKKPYGYVKYRILSDKMIKLPQRSWNKPVVLLINENSFSDAEIFPAIFKEFKLGKIVGMPTSGSVIGTYEIKLMDGSYMRMPSIGWYRLDKTDMEGSGTVPDIMVELTPKDYINHNDKQLKTAIEELLKEIKK